MVNAAIATPIIATYFGIWDKAHWADRFRTDTPFQKINRLYIAFGKIVKDNSGHFSIAFDGSESHAEDIIARMKKDNPSAQLFLTVGGNGGADSYGGAANDSQFAGHVLHFLDEYDLDGFDIDWENDLNKKDLNNLVTQLFSVLHAHQKQLTLDVWPFPNSTYDMKTLSNHLDEINIMSYGTGINLSECVGMYARRGFPKNKMIGGIETETNYDQNGGVTDTLGENGTIAKKAATAAKEGLAGMMSWRLDNDYAPEDRLYYPTYQGAVALHQDSQ
ncbi:MAG: hypothetical protein A3I77_08200 [Gammaproteobacteria bacterium RIFCSPLOWO2_02_FULL_42_14]|nr:MAG: hypothetical protein A3B71_04035 [Gammaproteobacteria bacterium RIFCSPHIGHO2_02_FULL_42_43]OGT52912.1 MAG: hypothetical protein A3E54_07490 [Gammaproteobacteria bacterium RIFCSPHIGHO2_12_FULL_41_25]OGT61314.1 MAG: hypothetical protein A3I77_08200 [Gammaproteobacteria bacterium RIFCSPLOWO2_02_FULL_42_14]